MIRVRGKMAEESIKFTGKTPAKILKWKVRQGSEIQRGSILCLFKSEDSDLTSKFKSTKGGTVLKCLVEEGNVIDVGADLIRLQGCSHTTVMKDLCALCGANLRNESGKPGDRIENVAASVAMVHSVPELIVSEEEAKKIGREDEIRLLRNRKLVLLVDLDQTLLHTTNDNVPANLKDAHHFQMWHGSGMMWYHTKFRPGIKHFLAKISQLYELHICTFGVRVYAHIIARILDPAGEYFSHRILSRDECFNPTSKTANLRALFPCGDSMVAIIDDREDVWNFSPNLIHVKPYQFFSGTADINAPPGLASSTAPNQPRDVNRRKSRVVRVPKRKPSTAQETKQTEEEKETCSKDTQEGDGTTSDGANPPSENNLSIEMSDKQEEKSLPNDTGQVAGDGLGNSSSTKEQEEETEQNDLDVSSSEDEEEDNTKEPTDPKKESEKGAEVSEGQNPDNSSPTDTKQDPDVKKESEKETENSQTETPDNISPTDRTEDPDPKKESEKGTEVSEAENPDIATPPTDGKQDPEPRESEKSQPNDGTSDGTVEGKENPETSVNVAKPVPESSLDQGSEAKAVKDSGERGQEGENPTKTEPEEEDVEYEEMVEWEDPDDYLLYLEEVLTRIHTAFYECYDQTKNRDSNVELPSLKKIIPYVHKKVLKGTNIVFSGVFPTNMPMEKSRAHIVARSLGANIQTAFVAPGAGCDPELATTHVVAARPGTQKVRQARKYKKVHVVTAEWLWTCADRWERVDERIYQLKEDGLSGPPRDSPDPRPEVRPGKRKSEDNLVVFDPVSGQRTQRQAKVAKLEECGMGDDTEPQPSTSEGLRAPPLLERRFSESYNPMLAFSRADIDDMDKEVEDILDASDSDDEDDDDEEKEEKKQEKDLRRKVLNSTPDTSSEDSLSADFPKGWRKKIYKKSPLSEQSQVKGDNGEEGEEEDRLEEEAADQPHRIMRHSSDSDSDDQNSQEDKESFNDSIGSVDEEMAAAVEKELLNF